VIVVFVATYTLLTYLLKSVDNQNLIDFIKVTHFCQLWYLLSYVIVL